MAGARAQASEQMASSLPHGSMSLQSLAGLAHVASRLLHVWFCHAGREHEHEHVLATRAGAAGVETRPRSLYEHRHFERRRRRGWNGAKGQRLQRLLSANSEAVSIDRRMPPRVCRGARRSATAHGGGEQQNNKTERELSRLVSFPC